jgi:hypothetical protein
MSAIHLHQIVERDGEITIKVPCTKGQFVEMILLLQSSETSKRPPLTARRLRQSGLIGLWRDRKDIEDSSDYAHQLRQQAQVRHR